MVLFARQFSALQLLNSVFIYDAHTWNYSSCSLCVEFQHWHGVCWFTAAKHSNLHAQWGTYLSVGILQWGFISHPHMHFLDFFYPTAELIFFRLFDVDLFLFTLFFFIPMHMQCHEIQNKRANKQGDIIDTSHRPDLYTVGIKLWNQHQNKSEITLHANQFFLYKSILIRRCHALKSSRRISYFCCRPFS